MGREGGRRWKGEEEMGRGMRGGEMGGRILKDMRGVDECEEYK